ncbi:hydrogenase maturation peptidase HycI [Azospirillum thermophilum]|uniref:Hydrogenase maturation peptidase HycI n=1 Tax=Azospirillum thermophilum TaxID=2202148 RepID=A0A2S2CMF6_9PROT|nr:hydrogenase maturation peptidase HycI [Azospirillum thermophilum]AWK85661.1 hydrogenase maturation peptidase HycI [Azospirillum thermophilum]
MTDVVFTVGNVLRGDDGAGPLLAQLLDEEPAPGWTVVDGADVPENHTHHIRALAPRRLLIVDAADMELAPGEVRLIDQDSVAEQFLVTTHAIPLNFLIDSLRETVPEVLFLGIQPQDTSFYAPVTTMVREAVEAVHDRLVRGEGFEVYQNAG